MSVPDRPARPEGGQRPLGVAVIEDHPLYREAVERVVDDSADLALMLSTASIEEFDARVREAPDVVVVDLHLPGLEGGAGVRHLASQGYVVLVLSGSFDGPDVVDAIAEGARGYLSKDAQAPEIVSAIRTVANGRSYVAPTLAGFLLQAHRQAPPSTTADLSEREREVLGLVAQGETDHAIGRILCISVSTVRSHLDRIRDKTGQRRRADLTRFAIRHAIVEE